MGHAVEWADAWHPIEPTAANVAPKLERFRMALRAAGRDPDKVPVSVVTAKLALADRVQDDLDNGRPQA